MRSLRILSAFLALLTCLSALQLCAVAEESEDSAVSGAAEESLEAEVKHELLDYMYVTSAGVESIISGDHDYSVNNARVPSANLQKSADGEYIRTEHKDGKVYVEYYDADFTFIPEKSMTFDLLLPEFGGTFFGEKYNYILSGNGDYTSAGEWALQQYDKDWNLVNSKIKEQHALAQNAIFAGSTSFSEYGDTMFIHTCFRMHSGVWDDKAHQGCIMFIVEQEDLKWETGFYFQASHSFNQFVINDGENLYTLDHSRSF